MPRALLAAVLALVLAPASAPADPAPAPWATVNVCDTARHPDAIGIRASIPGTPKGTHLAMRFRVQFKTAKGDWRDADGANSGWRQLGTAHGSAVESGWSFTFAHPDAPVTLRGVVRFRWRRGDVLPRQLELSTEAGHRSSAGADPAGYSAATCVLGT